MRSVQGRGSAKTGKPRQGRGTSNELWPESCHDSGLLQFPGSCCRSCSLPCPAGAVPCIGAVAAARSRSWHATLYWACSTWRRCWAKHSPRLGTVRAASASRDRLFMVPLSDLRQQADPAVNTREFPAHLVLCSSFLPWCRLLYLNPPQPPTARPLQTPAMTTDW